MRKNIKFLIACAVMAGIGLALTVIGGVLGGKIHGIQVDSDGIHVYAPLLDEGNRGDGVGYKREEEQLAAFDGIEVDAEYADIRIERSDSDAYTLSYCLSQDQGIQTEVKDGKLLLKHKSAPTVGISRVNVAWFLVGNTRTGTWQDEFITVRLPKDAKLSTVVLNTDSGDVICEGIQADSLKITAEYGDVSLLGVQAQKIGATLDSGKLQMEQVSGGSCSVVDEYGSAAFYDLTLAGDMKIEMESGDIRFRNAKMQSLELDSAYGDIDGQQAVFGDAQISLESGDCKLEKVSFHECRVNASYGSVDLRLENDVLDYRYQLDTKYGSIKIAGEKMGEAYSSLDKSLERLIEVHCESGDIRIQ